MANVRKKQITPAADEQLAAPQEGLAPDVAAQPETAPTIDAEEAKAKAEAIRAEAAEAEPEAGDNSGTAEDSPSAEMQESAEEAAEEQPAAPKQFASAPNVIDGVRTSRQRRKEAKARQAERDKKHEQAVELQRAKNEVSFEKAMAASQADDDEFDAYQAGIEEVDFEDEFISYEEEIARAAQPEGKQPKKKPAGPKTRFTTQDNNIAGDATTINVLVERQHEFFNTGKTLTVKWRKTALGRLYSLFEKYETPLLEALTRDLGISKYEAYLTELAPVHAELRMLNRKFETWTNPHRLFNSYWLPTMAKRYLHPHGTVCVINSWQSPVSGALIALGEALAVGNTVVLKNSSRTRRCNEVLASALVELFKTDYVRFITGGNDMDNVLLECQFDKYVYIGERERGEDVKRASITAAAPPTLMLDGNNPCYVDRTAKLNKAADKIMWAKMLHAGQTRLAPSFVFTASNCTKTFINRTYDFVRNAYGDDPIRAKGYPRMFSRKEYDAACAILDNLGPKAEIVYGGQRDPKTLRIAPTVILCESPTHPIFRKQIVGPILPVCGVKSAQEAFDQIEKMPTAPAFYLFSKLKAVVKYASTKLDFGQGCINEAMVQVMRRESPQSAAGEGGMGTMGAKYGLTEFGTWRVMDRGFGGFSSISRMRTMPMPDSISKVKRKWHYKST